MALQKSAAASAANIAAKARRRIVGSWIWTALVGGIASLVIIGAAVTPQKTYDYTTGAYASSPAPVSLLLLIPVVLYGSWALYWGWGPVWHGFLRGYNVVFGRVGCMIFMGWIFWVAVIAFIFELLALAAVTYGTLGGAFVQYKRAQELAKATLAFAPA